MMEDSDMAEAVRGKPLILVGIPAYNEEKTIAKVVLESQRFADKVVVCDDGSSDLTGAIAERLGADVVWHERNMGYGAAIQSLFKRARELGADVLVTLDGDGQHDPNEIPKLVEPILQGEADIVVGSRLVDERLRAVMPWYRRAGVKFITRLTNGSSEYDKIKDAQSGFRAYDRKCTENLIISENGMGASSEILINARKQHLKICEVASSCDYGNGMKTSKRNPVRHGIDVVASIIKLVVEDKPLTTGVFFGVWMLQMYASEHQIATNVALASIAFILIGLFSIFTAITLYAISRLAQRTNNRH
jgi:glycosyltransferase involved in cell wall biosynthesis